MKPNNETEYLAWAKENIASDFESAETASLIGVNLSAALNFVQESDFWRDLPAKLAELAAQYKVAHKAQLFPGGVEPLVQLQKKPYGSIVEKTFRLNVLWNHEWPEAPKSGWVSDQNVYAIDDLLRTTIVCNFIDGPGLVAEALEKLAKDKGLTCHVRKLSRQEGYYAHHLYVAFTLNLATRTGIEARQFEIEIQVTTQAQDLLRNLTHPYYQAQRIRPNPRDNWQWNYNTNKFRARYLSHTMHLLEALILEVRDNPDKED